MIPTGRFAVDEYTEFGEPKRRRKRLPVHDSTEWAWFRSCGNIPEGRIAVQVNSAKGLTFVRQQARVYPTTIMAVSRLFIWQKRPASRGYCEEKPSGFTHGNGHRLAAVGIALRRCKALDISITMAGVKSDIEAFCAVDELGHLPPLSTSNQNQAEKTRGCQNQNRNRPQVGIHCK